MSMRFFRGKRRTAGGYRRRSGGFKKGRRFRGVYKLSRGGIRL